MRIAFITHEPFYPPSGGGSAEAIYLVEELVKRGHEVHLFCPKVTEPQEVARRFKIILHQFTAWEMGRYTSLRNAKYLLYPYFLQRMVEMAAKKISFDAILSQHAISAVAAGRLKQSLKIPVVTNFLDYLTGFMETWPPYLAPPPLLRILKKFELNIPKRYSVDGVLTVSDTLADYFTETGYPKERIQPIYYGYDADLFSFRDPNNVTQRGKPPIVVMHGSLDHHHLRSIALEAIVHVHQSKPDVIFKFVGHRTGALDAFLTKVGNRIPEKNIQSTGFVPYKEVAAHLADATFGMVPYEESAGTHCAFVAKIVEYLAVGLPVVSTPLKSAQRYFKDEPMIRFSSFNGRDFGEKILSWLQEPPALWQPWARPASERVKANLDWRVISQRAIRFVEKTSQKAGKSRS